MAGESFLDQYEVAPGVQAPRPPTAKKSFLDDYELAPMQRTVPRPAVGFVENVQAGFQGSAPGLMWRGKLPNLFTDPETASWWERAASTFAHVGAELPLMIGGAMVGGPAGAAAGTAVAPGVGTVAGGLIGAGVMMGVVPATIRTSLTEAYKAGEAQEPADWFNIVREVAKQAAKEGAINAAAMGVGAVAGRAAGTLLAPAVGQKITAGTLTAGAEGADLATQIATMTVMPAAFEGRLPKAHEFMDAAILIGGLKAAHVTASRVMHIYQRTGKTPAEQVQDARADPAIAEEITKPAPAGAPAAIVPRETSGEIRMPTIQEALFRETQRLTALEEKAGGTVDRVVVDDFGNEVTIPGRPREFLTDAEKNELSILRERVKALERGDIAGIVISERPSYTGEQLTSAQARRDARVAELEAKTNALTDRERAERVFLTNADPEALARHFGLEAAERRPVTMADIEAGSKRIHDDVLRQLREVDEARRDAGISPLGDEHAMQIAALVQARVRTRAVRLGLTPEQVYGDKTLRIRDQAMAEVKAAEEAIPAGAPRFDLPPEVDLFGNPIAAPVVPRFAVENLETREVPLANLILSKEVPQFKHAADEQGVIVPLGGRFDRTGVGPIQVWERLNGALEVISGRHRLDLARRSGEETIPAQIHREADGFDARQAATLDAQLNIREEQGSVADYAQYFKDSGISKEAADERGLLARAKGRTGFAIARDGTEDLLAANRAGVLSDEAALSISLAAPGSDRLQALGIAMVNEGKSILVAVNTMKAVDLMAAERMAKGAQGDIFGFDDSAMQEASKMAKLASSAQRKIGEQIAAVSGASKRPELAKRMGVDVQDPQGIQKRIVELRQEQELWDNWPLHPELVAKLRAPEVTGREGDLKQGAVDERSPEFRAWFGDSKVVDAEGKPLVVYHGSSEGGGDAFTTFQGNHLAGWFSESAKLAGRYADNRDKGEYDATIYPVYLNIKRPLDLTFDKRFDLTNSEATVQELFDHFGLQTTNKTILLDGEGLYQSVNHRDFVEAARNAGYDGIKALEEGYVTWGAFSSRQVKSTIGNRGTFDPNDPNILRQEPFDLKPETPAELAARNAEAEAQARRKLAEEAPGGVRGRALTPQEAKAQADLFFAQQELFQQERGSYNVAEKLITTFERADKSTIVHEMGHDWLQEMKEDAARPDAPAQIKADWEQLRKELAIPEAGDIPRASHEQFARSVERYMADGEAPSVGLRGVFERFKAWMLEIYQTLLGMGAKINPEVKEILDRMLATDQEIADARALEVPRAYVNEAKETVVREIVPGFKAEQVALEPYADELPPGPGAAPGDSHVNYAGLDAPVKIKLTLQRLAEIDQQNVQKARGGKEGVETWQQEQAAMEGWILETLGGGADRMRLLKGSDPNDPKTNHRLRAMKQMMVGAGHESEKLRDTILEKGHNATIEEQLQYLSSIELLRQLHAEFLGERAAVARAMNALKDTTEGSAAVNNLLAAIGRGADANTLFQSAAEKAAADQAMLKARLDEILLRYKGKSVLDIAKLHKEIGTLKGTFKLAETIEKATTWEMIVEGWKSALLSGVVTHTTNLFGTGAFQALRAPVDALSAVIGMARGASPGMGESDRASMSEAVARVTGMLGGVKDGLTAGRAAFDMEPTGKTESYREAIPGRAGQLIRIPLRLMGAEDAIVSTMYKRGELATLAIRQAFDEGRDPGTREFADRVEALKQTPTPEMELAAEAAATRMTFNMPLGEKGVALQLFVNKWNLQWMIPFIRTPINITKEVARMSPFAPLVVEWRADIAKGGVARDRALAETALGTGIMALTMAYAFSGQITGSGGPDPGKNRGKAGVEQPMSIKIGDTWYEYQRIQPTGTLMGMAADLAIVWDHMTDEEKDKVPKLLARAFSNAVTNQTFLQGITNVINAMSEPARFAPKFVQQLAGSVVPNIIGQTTTMADPVVREVNSAMEAIQARIPGMRQDLMPKRDWLGEPVETKERLAVVGPVRTMKVSEDKVRLEAARLDISMAAAPKKTHIGKGTGKLGDVELTPSERNKFQEVGGQMAHKILAQIVTKPGYDAMPDLVKRQIFAKVLTASHQMAAVQALPMEKRAAYLQLITEKVAQQLAPTTE